MSMDVCIGSCQLLVGNWFQNASGFYRLNCHCRAPKIDVPKIDSPQLEPTSQKYFWLPKIEHHKNTQNRTLCIRVPKIDLNVFPKIEQVFVGLQWVSLRHLSTYLPQTFECCAYKLLFYSQSCSSCSHS